MVIDASKTKFAGQEAKEELKKAVQAFESRDRRFGAIKDEK